MVEFFLELTKIGVLKFLSRCKNNKKVVEKSEL